MIKRSQQEMETYYNKVKRIASGRVADPAENERLACLRKKVFDEMDVFDRAHPGTPAVLLKSHEHTLIAKYFEPVIFLGNPFFFELGIREAQTWGGTWWFSTAARWVYDKKMAQAYAEHPLCGVLEKRFCSLFDQNGMNVCRINTSFDPDHHTLGYTELFRVGIRGLIERARENACRFSEGSEARAFCEAVEESGLALIAIARKFSERAEQMLSVCEIEKERKYLEMMAQAAKRIPAEPPQSFYEGLAMLLFTREAISALEAIGISQLGHVDRLLGLLYEQDLRDGRITETEARELVSLWMMHTDIKFHLKTSSWPETSTCIQLGGCDENGNAVFNDVTRIFIEEHHRAHLVNPKLNCRYSKSSPDEYLVLIGKALLAGHNNFVLNNDDMIIPGLMQSGVEKSDAHRYVNGGCQETMIEGFGHTEGAGLYVSMLRLFDLFLRRDREDAFITPCGGANDFEDFYRQFLASVRGFLRLMVDQRNYRQHYMKHAYVAPLFSATQTGCIENGSDYAYGGAKYNFTSVALVGLANLADSMQAVKTFVFDEKRLTLENLNAILAANWEGNEALRRDAISLPKYGHGVPEVDLLADRLLRDISEIVQSQKNERGGSYIPSTFVYYYHEKFCHNLRATPDGRKDHDLTAMGCAPSQLQAVKAITAPFQSFANMHFADCGGGNHVFDIQLPLSTKLTPEIFAAFVRSCMQIGSPTLQPNVVSVEDLIDAKEHPERHGDLIVRICGLSAYFVALTPAVQEELIFRNLYQI